MMRTSTPRCPASPSGAGHRQRGASLIVVMLILIVVSGLGIGAVQISMMSERGARNDRDMQVAWQAAEAALMDAEFDIIGPLPSSRRAVFGAGGVSPDRTAFPVTGCGTSSSAVGLCALVDEAQAASNVKQNWLVADFELTSNAAPTAFLGQFTGQPRYPIGSGVRPAQEPRYMIEPIRDDWVTRDKSKADAAYLYRVTAMGFGPRQDIQAVAQMLLRP